MCNTSNGLFNDDEKRVGSKEEGRERESERSKEFGGGVGGCVCTIVN